MVDVIEASGGSRDVAFPEKVVSYFLMSSPIYCIAGWHFYRKCGLSMLRYQYILIFFALN